MSHDCRHYNHLYDHLLSISTTKYAAVYCNTRHSWQQDGMIRSRAVKSPAIIMEKNRDSLNWDQMSSRRLRVKQGVEQLNCVYTTFDAQKATKASQGQFLNQVKINTNLRPQSNVQPKKVADFKTKAKAHSFITKSISDVFNSTQVVLPSTLVCLLYVIIIRILTGCVTRPCGHYGPRAIFVNVSSSSLVYFPLTLYEFLKILYGESMELSNRVGWKWGAFYYHCTSCCVEIMDCIFMVQGIRLQ